VEGFWDLALSILFSSVIPVAVLLYLVWCAIRLTSAIDQPPPESRDHDPRRWHRAPRRPRGPRRGPHTPGDFGAPVHADRGADR
jgi:hypothetical protein